MKCYYEVLGIERTATPDEIKKAHRKLALKWHPDKNMNNQEEAHKVYQVIQEAYDCLSDPQEKAFYDKHRETILRGGSDHKSDEVDVMSYYSSSCYSGFTDEPGSFYPVYSELFVRLAQEDERYVDSSDWEIPPIFGDSTTPYPDVREFYGWWQSYCTKKNYLWLDDLYDIRQAENRRVQRAIEKENKKVTEDARREFNEQVRSLVSHIRKKDPRVLAQREKQREMDEEKAVAGKKRIAEQRRKRAEEVAMLAEQEKEMIAAHNEAVAGLMEEYSDSEDEGDAFHCPLCRKTFKSDKMMKQHEKSKKHKEKLAQLRLEFADELGDDITNEEEEVISPTLANSSGKSKKKKKKNRRAMKEEEDEEDPYDMTELKDNLNDGPELKPVNNNPLEEDTPVLSPEVETPLSPEETTPLSPEETTPLSPEVQCDYIPGGPPLPSEDADEEEWRVYMSYYYTGEETTYCGIPVMTRPPPGDCRHLPPSERSIISPTTGEDDEEEYTIVTTAPTKRDLAATGPKGAACNMCKETFASKTKLFAHLKETGHAIKPEFVPKVTAQKKGKRGKKR